MPHQFVAQPHADGFDLLDFLEAVSTDGEMHHLDIVVAWVKRSGVTAVAGELRRFRERGGFIRAIVGISQGGTSRQGLEGILRLVDETFLFHHPGRTFHPKIFVAQGPSRAAVLVGSNNLTFGGTQHNYEAAILSELNFDEAPDAEFMMSVVDYIDRLLADDELCRPLDDELLTTIVSNQRYPLDDEDAPDRSRSDEEFGDDGFDESERIFGSSRFSMRTPRVGRPSDESEDEGSTSDNLPPEPSAMPSDQPDEVVRRWYKVLPKADAQQLATSSPSNTMTLVQAGHDLQRETYFRDEFFGDAPWHAGTTRGGQAREVAVLDIEVYVHGASHGLHSFEIRHTPGYEAGEANRTTEFAWGEFGEYLRQHPLVGDYATLEKTGSGRYRLIIGSGPTGPFLY